MILVELYSKDECHLCDAAFEVLTSAQQKLPFALERIKIYDGHARYEEFKDNVPVVFINKEFAFQHRVPEQAFLARLRKAQREQSL